MLARYYNIEFENFKMNYALDADKGWLFFKIKLIKTLYNYKIIFFFYKRNKCSGNKLL